MKAAGELDARFIWYGLKGARKYAASDIAPDAAIDERKGKCATCPARTEFAGAVYCGPIGENRMSLPLAERSCGCLIDGKAAVASEECPQERWAGGASHQPITM